MQTLLTSSKGRNGQLPYSKTSMRLRAFRFLGERFAQRERPSVAAEFVLFAAASSRNAAAALLSARSGLRNKVSSRVGTGFAKGTATQSFTNSVAAIISGITVTPSPAPTILAIVTS